MRPGQHPQHGVARRLIQANSGKPNVLLKNRQIEKQCHLNDANNKLVEQVIERLGLSARAYHRILKVARTIADLAASDDINTTHLTETILYRRQDRRQTS